MSTKLFFIRAISIVFLCSCSETSVNDIIVDIKADEPRNVLSIPVT